MTILRGKIIHDTRKIIEADAGAGALFRATLDQLIGSPFIELFDGDLDMIQLEALRLKFMIEKDSAFEGLDWIFKRFDNTYFYGHAVTTCIGDQVWQTTIEHQYETHGPEY